MKPVKAEAGAGPRGKEQGRRSSAPKQSIADPMQEDGAAAPSQGRLARPRSDDWPQELAGQAAKRSRTGQNTAVSSKTGAAFSSAAATGWKQQEGAVARPLDRRPKQGAADAQGMQRPVSSRPAASTQQAPRQSQGRPQSAQPVQQQQQQPKQAAARQPQPAPASGVKPINSTALQHQSDVRFDSLAISPLTKRAMAEVFGYEFCTKVQAQSLPVCLSGTDVLAKAKTGTGKTLAFMIPALEDLSRSPPRQGQIGVLVLSPTRELAMQIHTETAKLLTHHQMRVQVVIGGTNITSETRRLQAQAPHVLIATPGRCLDHLSNNVTGLQNMMKDLRMLVLDEADNILDMGFRPCIEKILKLVPDKAKRQTLLFSATFPSNVKELAKFALRPSYEVVDTVGEDTGTNVQVEQLSCVAPHKDLMLYLVAVMKTHMAQESEFKVIVFFPTARMTQLYSEAFVRMNFPVLEMHSRKSQAVRTRMSEQFRSSNQVIMFSSDVSARGVDYPDVSLVVQVGLPTDKAQYVHRVGRTARAGKTGQSLLLLADFEGGFLKKLAGLPVANMGQLSPAVLQTDAEALKKALTQVSPDTKGKAYAAWLGFYKSAPGLSMTSVQVVDKANEFSRIIGCLEPPELEAKTVGKMGLKGVPGLRIAGRGPAPASYKPQAFHHSR